MNKLQALVAMSDRGQTGRSLYTIQVRVTLVSAYRTLLEVVVAFWSFRNVFVRMAYEISVRDTLQRK